MGDNSRMSAVLIVEDSENSAALLEMAFLGIPGVSVLMAPSATEALRILDGSGAVQAMVTDLTSTFDESADCIRIVGYDMSREAARQAYEEAQAGPQEVQVIELHDCFSANELITYEALGLAPEGEGHKLVESEATTYGGEGPVVNPSGGLISKGHPLGATGLAQCSELCWQLNRQAGERQVDGAQQALQHNIGLGGAAVVTVYRNARG